VQTLPPYRHEFNGKGIVMCAGGLSYFTCAWIAIKAIRRAGCSLPIQLWYVGNELSGEAIEALGEMNVDCENFLRHENAPWQGFLLKPFAILHSRFKGVLYIDADNVCVSDPTALFFTEEYLQYGAVFWPDFWKTDRENPIWEIIGSTAFDTKEQDSGQLLVDKEKCWKELNLCLYFNSMSEVYYEYVAGCKDIFRIAWMALKTPWHMITTEVAICGYPHPTTSTFLGTTMVQHNTKGEIQFMHRKLMKWDITRENELIWKKIKKIVPGSGQRRYLLTKINETGPAFMDLQGDVEEIDFTVLMNDLEVDCLSDLEALRRSKMYARFLIHTYFRGRRYILANIPFQLNDSNEASAYASGISFSKKAI
jgi:alpha 1,2-mannosyltransferase